MPHLDLAGAMLRNGGIVGDVLLRECRCRCGDDEHRCCERAPPVSRMRIKRVQSRVHQRDANHALTPDAQVLADDSAARDVKVLGGILEVSESASGVGSRIIGIGIIIVIGSAVRRGFSRWW